MTRDPQDDDVQATVTGAAIDQFARQVTALFLPEGVQAMVVAIERFTFSYPDPSPIIREIVRTTLGFPFAEELAHKVANVVYDLATDTLADRLDRAGVRIDEDSEEHEESDATR